MSQQSEAQLKEEQKAHAEHQHVLSCIKSVLATRAGYDFIKYLLTSFDLSELPPIGLSQEFLLENLGMLRAGRSIYKIIAQANPEMVGTILGQIEKDKHVQAHYDSRQG